MLVEYVMSGCCVLCVAAQNHCTATCQAKQRQPCFALLQSSAQAGPTQHRLNWHAQVFAAGAEANPVLNAVQLRFIWLLLADDETKPLESGLMSEVLRLSQRLF